VRLIVVAKAKLHDKECDRTRNTCSALDEVESSAAACKEFSNFCSGVSRLIEVLRANGFAVEQRTTNPHF
jgi:hypothetical protein